MLIKKSEHALEIVVTGVPPVTMVRVSDALAHSRSQDRTDHLAYRPFSWWADVLFGPTVYLFIYLLVCLAHKTHR